MHHGLIDASVAGAILVLYVARRLRQQRRRRRQLAQMRDQLTAEYRKLWDEYTSEHPPAPLPPHVTPKQVSGVVSDLLKSYGEQPCRVLSPEIGPVTYDPETKCIHCTIPCDIETIGRYVEMSYEDGEPHEMVTLWLKEHGYLQAFVEVMLESGERRWMLAPVVVEVS